MEGQGAPPGAPSSPYEAKKAILMANLEVANRARKAKKALREAIKAGEINDLEVLRGGSRYEDLVRGWPVERLMLLMRRIGKSRVTDILDFCRIRPHTKLMHLSFAQREQLALQVEEIRSRGGVLPR
jgi:hypothetical protein